MSNALSKSILMAAVLLTLTLNMGCASSTQAPGTSTPAATGSETTNPELAKLDAEIAEQQKALDKQNQKIADMESERNKARSSDPVHQEEVDRLENELEGLTEGLAHMEDALNTLKEQRAALAKSVKP